MSRALTPADQRASGSLLYLTLVCLVATLGGLLFGYDTGVISGAIGFLQCHFSFGADMKGWVASCALAGCCVGVLAAGPLSDRFGRRNTLIVAAVLFLASALGTALPRTLAVFITFRFIGGLGVGAASMTSPMYIAEISPAHIRGRMVSVNQLAIVSGFLLVYFVNYFITVYGQALDHQAGITVAAEGWNALYGWRWMFGSEAIPALLLMVLLLFVPESPRWLTEQGQTGQARSILARIGGDDHAEREMAEIRAALAEESTSLAQLLLPGMRRVLAIGVVLAVLQQVTGINVVLYYAPEIFKTVVGAKVDVAMLHTVVLGAANLLFTIIAIWTVDKFGRKPLMITGATGMGISLAAIGVAAYLDQLAAWALSFFVGYVASFALSVGPVTWVILSEIFPTKIRGRAMAIATFFLWVANFVVSQTFPKMDDNPWLVERFHHGFPFWFYGAFCLVLLIFTVAAVPETKGRSLEEIERGWLHH